MLIDKIRKYYNKEIYDLNCAETILYGANEEYKMNLSKETLKSVAAFGGGMAIESTCGCITGALAVLGILFIKERAHESEIIKNITIQFINEFELRLKTTNCKDLKEKYKTENLRCSIIIDCTAEILDEIVQKERVK